MAAGFGERQRAEQFARLLDGLDDAGSGTSGVATLVPEQAPDPELASMLRVVEDVINEGRFHGPAVRPEFKAELGARLHRDFLVLFNADVAPDDDNNGDVLTRHRNPWRRRLIGGGVAVGVLSGGLGGVAWAASNALPGDPLYGVKRGLENMRVSISGSDLERGEQYLGQAKHRLEEIRKLQGRHDSNLDGSPTSKLIMSPLDNLSKDMDNAGQLLAPLAESGNVDALNNLQNFLQTYDPQVHDLETLLAPESQGKARQIATMMDGLLDRMTAARAELDRLHAGQTAPAGSGSSGHHTDANQPGAPTGTSAPGASEGQRPAGPAGATDAAPAGGGTPDAPSSDGGVHIGVPLGSSNTTLTVPSLISGLPPIGITLGNTAPATGPTSDAGPPNTDPNPN